MVMLMIATCLDIFNNRNVQIKNGILEQMFKKIRIGAAMETPSQYLKFNMKTS